MKNKVKKPSSISNIFYCNAVKHIPIRYSEQVTSNNTNQSQSISINRKLTQASSETLLLRVLRIHTIQTFKKKHTHAHTHTHMHTISRNKHATKH